MRHSYYAHGSVGANYTASLVQITWYRWRIFPGTFTGFLNADFKKSNRPHILSKPGPASRSSIPRKMVKNIAARTLPAFFDT